MNAYVNSIQVCYCYAKKNTSGLQNHSLGKMPMSTTQGGILALAEHGIQSFNIRITLKNQKGNAEENRIQDSSLKPYRTDVTVTSNLYV